MKKLFVFQDRVDIDRSKELDSGFKKCNDNPQRVKLNKLSVDYLIDNSIDVVISNGLPKEWYFILKGLNIVTVTLDEIDEYFQLADIVIDYKSEDNNRYFTGKQYSICENKDLAFNDIANLITILEWDSNFWGFPVAYLSSKYLTDNVMQKNEKFIKINNIKLIEYLCNCHDNRSVTVAEKNGFHFTDIRLSFEKELKTRCDCKLPDNITFGKARDSDIQKLKKISTNLYKYSRYFFDENFDRRKVNEFYNNWVEKAVLGQYDDECYCLYDQGIPFEFCTVKYNISNSVTIGLFGLSEEYQGKGLAKILLNMVFNTLMDKEKNKVFVVTQGRNYNAQRLYQSVGFFTKATELWYHKWL